jgi:hypothetical protein
MAIFVVGMHKSGMRVVASILQSLGAKLAPDAEELFDAGTSDFGHPKNKSAESISQNFLKKNGLNCLTLPLIDSRPTLSGIDEYTQSIAKIFEGSDPQRSWCFSDPRLSFLLPYWKTVAKPSSAIICLRRPDIVSLSLAQHNKISANHAAALWELYTLAALRNTRRMPCAVVVYEELLAKPEAAIKKLVSAIPELARFSPSPDAIKAAVAHVRRSPDQRGPDNRKAPHSTAVELYERLVTGDIKGARKHTPMSFALELIRLEADRRSARQAVAEAGEQINQAHKQVATQKVEISRHSERLRDIVSLIVESGQSLPTDPGALLDRLYQAVRGLETPEAVTRARTEAAELLHAKNDRIEWLRQELDATGTRAQAILDKSLALELEVLRWRAEHEQKARAKNDSRAENRRLASDLQVLQSQFSQSEEDRARLRIEYARLETEKEIALAKFSAEHETRIAEIELRREQFDEEKSSLLEKHRSELLEAELTISRLRAELAERETLNAALAHATLMLEQREQELTEGAAQQQVLTEHVNRLTAEIERAQRELQESKLREADLASSLRSRDLSENVLRAAVSQQEAVASALQSQLTLARENIDHLTKQLERRVELCTHNEARHLSDRRMLAEYAARVPLLEAIAAESPGLSARINSLQDDIKRTTKERDDAVEANKSSAAAHKAQLSELSKLARRAIRERDQALAALTERDAAIRERDAEIVSLHGQIVASEKARNEVGQPHSTQEGG